jgi:hypothetical protein
VEDLAAVFVGGAAEAQSLPQDRILNYRGFHFRLLCQ